MQEHRKRELAYLKLWPAVQNEFKLGSTKEEAFRNIFRKSGRNPPSYSEVHDWLQEYYDGVLNEDIDDFYGNVRSAVIGQYLKLDSAIYFSGNWKFNNMEATLYSRFMFVYSKRYSQSVSILDSFSGEHRALKGPTSVDATSFLYPVWIDSTHVLVKKFERSGVCPLLLLKIDLNELKWTVSAKFVPSLLYYHVIIDSADSTRFSLISEDSDSTFIHPGKVIDDQIVMKGNPIEIYARLRYPKLEDSHLYGFQRVNNEENGREEWRFEEYVLDEKPGRKVSSVKSYFCNTELDTDYIWSKNRLFVLVYYFDFPKYFTVAAFNPKKNSWSRAKVVGAAFPNSITVDDDEVLTIGTLDGDWSDVVQPIYKTVHRFPMHKPDKLSYLAWFTIRRGSMFFESDLHDKFAPLLPYTCEFRSVFEDQ